jgi:hypothetical protein
VALTPKGIECLHALVDESGYILKVLIGPIFDGCEKSAEQTAQKDTLLSIQQ